MGKNYYCEFCERSFADILSIRKKHILSTQHQRMRKLHYDSYKDAASILNEESQKNPCNRFFQTVMFSILSYMFSILTYMVSILNYVFYIKFYVFYIKLFLSSTTSLRLSMNIGHCDFGEHCRFSHKNVTILQQQVEQERQQTMSINWEEIEKWVEKWKKKFQPKDQETYRLPHGFLSPDQLPPSLQPPLENINLQPLNWGE
ncbi:zinc finger matrin-type protein 5 isoform X1 [Hydra vulgaris]|uniref:zinc finger matrin-type protein 5 isoform X1 n=1 Tax=Hydra vulgaris TaxID=6087 RepID=UPI001F5FC627|nr:zinc finger matrin-type protein 5-like [Hydra vulgaris]